MIKKLSINILKILLAVFISAILIICIGLWRLSEAPLQLRTEAFEKFLPMENFKYGAIFLENPDLSTLPTLTVHNIQFTNENIDIKSDKLSAQWSIFKLLYGKFSLSSLHIHAPEISIFYSLRKSKKTNDTSIPQSISTLHSLIDKTWLPAKNIIIKNSHVKFYKMKKKVGEVKNVSFRYYTHKGISVGRLEIKPSEKAKPIVLSTTYSTRSQVLKYDLNSDGFLLKNSYLPYRFRPYLKQFGFITSTPLVLSSQGYLDLSDEKFQGELKTNIAFSLGQDKKIQLSAKNKISSQNGDLILNNEAAAREFDWSCLSNLWPKNLGSTARSWVLENMVGGTSTGSKINFDVLCNLKNKTTKVDNLRGTVGVKNTTVSYLGNLPKIKNASAQATFDKQKFDIKLTHGNAYNLEIKGGHVLLYDLNTNKEKANLNIDIEGPIKDVLKLVDQKPLEFIKPYPIDIPNFQGDTKLNLKLNFPLKSDLSPQEVSSNVKANLNNIDYSYKLMDNNIHIAAKAMELEVTNDGLVLLGDCEIDNHPSFLKWQEFFKTDASPSQIFELNTTLPFHNIGHYLPYGIKSYIAKKDIISAQGTSKISLKYTQKTSTESSLNVHADLSNNIFDLIPIKVRLPKEKSNYFNILLNFKNGNLSQIKPFAFITPKAKIKGSVDYKENGGIKNVTIDNATIIDSHIKASGSMNNNLLKVNAASDEINLEPILKHLKKKTEDDKGNKGTEAPIDKEKSRYEFSIDLNARLSKLLMANNVELPNVIIESIYKKGDLEKLTVNSKQENKVFFEMYYGPQEDKTVFEAKSNDMGLLLSGLNISKDIQATLLYTRSEKLKHSDAPMIGNLKIRGLRVKNAPILAKLFSLMSFESLLTNLTGQGILFVKGNAEYEYKDKKIAVKKSNLTSSGIGLTTQGYIDMNKNLLDLHGVIIPANMFNQAITGIPIIGSILTGGQTDSGIISTSYAIKGSTEDPEINTNPLSVLAPTLVRSIFNGIFGSKEKEIGIENFPNLEPNNKKLEKVN